MKGRRESCTLKAEVLAMCYENSVLNPILYLYIFLSAKLINLASPEQKYTIAALFSPRKKHKEFLFDMWN